MPTNKPEVVLPTVPQAFFDEFGVNADDRVMDYGQACYDAGVLSAAPQQHGQEVVSECASCSPDGVFADDGSGPFDCYACGRKAQPQQPAEAVAGFVDSEQLDELKRGGCVAIQLGTYSKRYRRTLPLYTTQPTAIDIGKLRELSKRALPFLRDEGANYEDDGSNEPLELAREIEAALIGDGGEKGNG